MTLGSRALVGAALLVLTTTSLAVGADQASQSDNLKLLQHFDLYLANEIEFDGSRIYVNQYAQGQDIGVHLFEIGTSGKVRKTGSVACSGLTDTAALDDGFIAIGLQQGGDYCNADPPLVTGKSGGVHIADMSKPSKPRLLGHITLAGGIHTLTRYPGKPFVYASVGGYDEQALNRGAEYIVDVSDPKKPELATTYTSPLNPGGCHDVLFQEIDGKMIGFCPGQGGTEIWDASDPLAPVPLGRMLVPFIQLPHQVAVSSDGQLAAVSDEAYAAHTCGGGGGPVGALWFYDISDLTNPQLLGFYGPQRGTYPVGSLSGQTLSCTAHNFNFIPDSRLMVVAWIAGGTTVLDVEDPSAATEVAHYVPDGAVAMSSYWYRDRIYVADFSKGFDVLKLDL